MLLKEWTIVTTSEPWGRGFGRRCDGRHRHARIEGQDTEASGHDPPAMARAVVRAMLRGPKRSDIATWPAGDDLLNEIGHQSKNYLQDTEGQEKETDVRGPDV